MENNIATLESKLNFSVQDNMEANSGIRLLWSKFKKAPLVLKVLLILGLVTGIVFAVAIPIVIIKSKSNQADDQPDNHLPELDQEKIDQDRAEEKKLSRLKLIESKIYDFDKDLEVLEKNFSPGYDLDSFFLELHDKYNLIYAWCDEFKDLSTCSFIHPSVYF